MGFNSGFKVLIQYSRLSIHLCYKTFAIVKTFTAITSAQETSKRSCKIRKHVCVRVCSLYAYILQEHALSEVILQEHALSEVMYPVVWSNFKYCHHDGTVLPLVIRFWVTEFQYQCRPLPSTERKIFLFEHQEKENLLRGQSSKCDAARKCKSVSGVVENHYWR